MEKVKAIHTAYYTRIRAYAAIGHKRLIENASPEHAAYLIEKMFEHAEKRMRIFSGNLARTKNNSDGDAVPIFSDQELIDSAAEFLDRKGTLDIVVVDGVDGGTESHPLLQRLKKATEGHYAISRLNQQGKEALTEDTKGHFVVMDDHGYRLETDDMEVKAYANFGDPEWARTLTNFFDKTLMPNADLVDLAV